MEHLRTGPDEGGVYRPTHLVRLLHAFPHVNISLRLVNSSFAPRSEMYLESLGILGSIPAAILILTLLILLIYLLTRCCDRKPRPRHSIVLLKWTLAIFTLLCCGVVGIGLYGNDDVHNGLVHFLEAVRYMDDIITAVKNQTKAIETTLDRKVQPLLTELGDALERPMSNQTVRRLLLGALGNVTNGTKTALECTRSIARPIQAVDVRALFAFVDFAETARYPLTMCVLSVLLVFCIVLLFGVACHSRCALITFSVFGLFAVIISWLMASLYLASSVAIGDLCIAPEQFLASELATSSASTPGSTGMRLQVISYYIRCESSRSNPFLQRLRESQHAVKTMSLNLGVIVKHLSEMDRSEEIRPKLEVLTQDANNADRLVSGLTTLLDCKLLHRYYMSAVNSVCGLSLYGLSFMLMASVAAGFIFTVLVWVDSHTWIYIRKRRDYHQVDEQDPFLPAGSAASQAIAARTLRSQGSYGRRSSPYNPYLSGSSSTLPRHHLVQHGTPSSGGSLPRRGFGIASGTPPPPYRYLAGSHQDMDDVSGRLLPLTATAPSATLLIDGRGEPKSLHSADYDTARGRGSGAGTSAHHHHHGSSSQGAPTGTLAGPNHGQYATLSKQCKTLESNDFY